MTTKIEQALAQMESRGHRDTPYYQNLLDKYNLIKSGTNYELIDVTEPTIKAVGALCAYVSRTWRTP